MLLSQRMFVQLWETWGLRLIITSLAAWLTLAYAILPKFWQHSKTAKTEVHLLATRTKQGLPGDPINLALEGDRAALACIFKHIGWQVPQPVTLKSAVKISASVVADHPYTTAPVSALYYDGRVQDIAFEQEVGRSANRRHHIRLWQVAPDRWLGAVTFDIGSGLNKYTGQITHHIDGNVDHERDTLASLLQAQGAKVGPDQLSGLPPQTVLRNGGGDKFETDGKIKNLTVAHACDGTVPAVK